MLKERDAALRASLVPVQQSAVEKQQHPSKGKTSSSTAFAEIMLKEMISSLGSSSALSMNTEALSSSMVENKRTLLLLRQKEIQTELEYASMKLALKRAEDELAFTNRKRNLELSREESQMRAST